MRCKPKHLLCSNTTNSSPDKQRGVSKETTGKEREREGMGWDDGGGGGGVDHCLCHKQPFALPDITGDSLSAWLEGTRGERESKQCTPRCSMVLCHV